MKYLMKELDIWMSGIFCISTVKHNFKATLFWFYKKFSPYLKINIKMIQTIFNTTLLISLISPEKSFIFLMLTKLCCEDLNQHFLGF